MHFYSYSVALALASLSEAMSLEPRFEFDLLAFAQLSADDIPVMASSTVAVNEAEF